MRHDSRQQAEAVLFGAVMRGVDVNALPEGQAGSQFCDGGFLALVFQKQFSVSLGVERFEPAFAIDFAVNDIPCFPVVQSMFDLHLNTRGNVGSLPVKWH